MYSPSVCISVTLRTCMRFYCRSSQNALKKAVLQIVWKSGAFALKIQNLGFFWYPLGWRSLKCGRRDLRMRGAKWHFAPPQVPDDLETWSDMRFQKFRMFLTSTRVDLSFERDFSTFHLAVLKCQLLKERKAKILVQMSHFASNLIGISPLCCS